MSNDAIFNVHSRVAEDACAEFVMDEDTFRAFYERTARGVWSYLARLTGDRQLADDLLQEAFYRFLRANVAHETEAHRRNYLYRIATNLARDTRRRTSRNPGSIQSGEDVESLPSASGPADSDRRADVNRALEHLNQRDRAMLWLAYAEGATHSEIASTLGLNPSSLKVMLFRARRRLADLLRRPAEAKEGSK